MKRSGFIRDITRLVAIAAISICAISTYINGHLPFDAPSETAYSC